MACRLHPYRLALARSYQWARGTQRERVGGLVECGGGWGEVAYPPDQAFDAAGVARALANAIDPTTLADPRIRCGADTAAMDAAARRADVPLARMLAPDRRPRQDVHVNALVVGDDPAQILAQVDAAARSGIRVLKIKCGADRVADLQRVQAVRAAAPWATLRLDPNGAWAPAWARQHMEDLAPYGIDYVEQPLPPHEEEALARLAQGAPFQVALDESAVDASAIRELLAAGAGQVVILKPQRLGGPRGTLDAMQAAEDAGARVVVTNSLETSIGVHAALHCASLLRRPEACGLATSGFLAQDVAPPPPIRDGTMSLPRAAGIGATPRLPLQQEAL